MKILRIGTTLLIWTAASLLLGCAVVGLWSWREARSLTDVQKGRVSRLGDQFRRVEFWAWRDSEMFFFHRQNYPNPPLPPEFAHLTPTGWHASKVLTMRFDDPFPATPEQVIFDHFGLRVWRIRFVKPNGHDVSDRLLFLFPGKYAVVLALPFVSLVTLRAAKVIRRRRRRMANLCVNCGYSMAGNVSGRCPECGNPPLT
jgi:hypothetical protein